MSSNPNIKINPKWGFKVEKDSNGILQIHFDTCSGKRNETPQFLVAVLINYLLKSVKEFIGFRPKFVQIQLGNNFRWIVNGVTEALKILDDKYDIKCEWTEKLIKAEIL
uniref:Uncharacterized protein n=1 Tax=Panagrolaimus davidi TaxID=227884 RepID=A0A914PBI3_9BILA